MSKMTHSWQDLAEVDGIMTSRYVDRDEYKSHKMRFDDTYNFDSSNVSLMVDFLRQEYLSIGEFFDRFIILLIPTSNN